MPTIGSSCMDGPHRIEESGMTRKLAGPLLLLPLGLLILA